MNLPKRLNALAAMIAASLRKVRALMRQVDERVTSHRDALRFRTVERVAMHRLGQVEHARDRPL